MTQAKPCRWCHAPFKPRAAGKPQRFCSPGCRGQFHTAARRFTEREIEAGRWSVAELRVHAPPDLSGLGGSVVPFRRRADWMTTGIATLFDFLPQPAARSTVVAMSHNRKIIKRNR